MQRLAHTHLVINVHGTRAATGNWTHWISGQISAAHPFPIGIIAALGGRAPSAIFVLNTQVVALALKSEAAGLMAAFGGACSTC